jgi:hypothetical protein
VQEGMQQMRIWWPIDDGAKIYMRDVEEDAELSVHQSGDGSPGIFLKN